MFITVEDETGVVNLILWQDRFAAQRRLLLSTGIVACHGRARREGEAASSPTGWRTRPTRCATAASGMSRF